MYKVQGKPDKEFETERGVKIRPLVTLKDEYGAVAHICEDDHCYVLYLRIANYFRKDIFCMATHWFPEAADALCGYLKKANGGEE